MATDWRSPSGVGDPTYDEWTNGANIYSSDDNYATATAVNTREDTDGYSFTLIAGPGNYLVIEQLHCRIEAKTTKVSGLGKCTLSVALSWDGGTSWTSEYTAMWEFADGEVVKDITVPYAGNYLSWGRNWKPSELSAANFRARLRVTKLDATTTVWVDHMEVGVDSHQASDVGCMGHITDDTEIVSAF